MGLFHCIVGLRCCIMGLLLHGGTILLHHGIVLVHHLCREHRNGVCWIRILCRCIVTNVISLCHWLLLIVTCRSMLYAMLYANDCTLLSLGGVCAIVCLHETVYTEECGKWVVYHNLLTCLHAFTHSYMHAFMHAHSVRWGFNSMCARQEWWCVCLCASMHARDVAFACRCMTPKHCMFAACDRTCRSMIFAHDWMLGLGVGLILMWISASWGSMFVFSLGTMTVVLSEIVFQNQSR